MDSSSIFCSKCLKLKDSSEFSKTQIRKKGVKTCLACVEAQNASDISSINITKKEITIPKQIPDSLFKPLYGNDADKADKMICLTMHQPWASLLVYGIKRAEGRGWNTDFRGRLWIHAGINFCFI